MKEAIVENNPFAARLERAEFASAVPRWLGELRKAAAERFIALGLPSPRDEEWRQTNIAPIARTAFGQPGTGRPGAAERALAALPLADLRAPRIVLWNGRHAPDLCAGSTLRDGVRLESLAAALAARPDDLRERLGRVVAWQDRAFAALNTASFEDGALVVVPSGLVLEEPLHVVHLSSAASEPGMSHPRTLVVVGDNSQATVVETYLGGEGDVYLTNAVTEISVGRNSRLDHYRVQSESRKAYHVASLQARQERDSRLVCVSVSLGAELTRNDTGAALEGEGAEATLDGLYVGGGSQHVDNHTTLDHVRARCASHELYKGILGGSSRAVFNGRIVVHPDAQKTDAKQSNRNLLLSDDAVAFTRPQLEIYADDVKCTHGATIGQLAEEALFYLRTRGIDRDSARDLLIHAFASDVLRRISVPLLRERIETDVLARLPRVGAAGTGR